MSIHILPLNKEKPANYATTEDSSAVAEGCFVVVEAAYIVHMAERQEA